MPTEQTQSPSLEALRKVIEAADTSRVVKKDFEDLAKQIIEIVRADKQINAQKRADMEARLSQAISALESRVEADLSDFRASIQGAVDQALSQMRFQHEAMLSEVDARMATIENGKDADETAIVEKVLSQLPPKEELAEETPVEVRDKLETLDGDERLDAKYIKGLEEMIKKLTKNMNLGGFVGAHAFSPTILEASGTIDDSNVTFAFATKPTLVNVNGSFYPENHGWTYTGGNVVLDAAPGTTGHVFALK